MLKSIARKFLKRTSSPSAFEHLRMLWWGSTFYVPRRLMSTFIDRRPTVYGRPPEFTTKLSNINTFTPTPLCRLMTSLYSDKGNARHNYTTVYSALFSSLQERPLRIFELGLGSNDPAIRYSMGLEGKPGASLRGWKEFFPRAEVFGADIDRKALLTEDRIETFYCDQLDPEAIRAMWSMPQLLEPMDIIIEDGLHTFEANVSFLTGSLTKLRRGGYYIVEDIGRPDLDLWKERLGDYERDFPDYDFALAELPNRINSYDNNLLVIRRHL
jgi:hypothetical protein